MTRRATIAELAAWLRERDDFAIFGHVNPDGDAVGSCMALKLALERLGKRAVAVLPGGMPEMYAWGPRAGEALASGEALPFVPKACVSLDTSDEPRLGAGRDAFFAAPESVMIDHHATSAGYGDLCYIDPEAAATGEIVLPLIQALGVEPAGDVAEWLYIAISTDCGQFSFSNTRPDTMRAAAVLMEGGVDVAGITRRLYHTRPLRKVRLTAKVLSAMQLSEDGRMAWSILPESFLKETGALGEDSDGIINEMLEIEGVEFALLATQRGCNVKCSLRSKQRLDVGKDVASAFGGGGHARAAGCTLENVTLDEALSRVLARARDALERMA